MIKKDGNGHNKKKFIDKEIPFKDEILSMEYEEGKKLVSHMKNTYTTKALQKYWGVTAYTLYNVIFKKFDLYDGFPSAKPEYKANRKKVTENTAKQINIEDNISEEKTKLVKLSDMYSDNHNETEYNDLQENYKSIEVPYDNNSIIDNTNATDNHTILQRETMLIPSKSISYNIPKELDENDFNGLNLKLKGIFNGEKLINKIKNLSAIIEENEEYSFELKIIEKTK